MASASAGFGVPSAVGTVARGVAPGDPAIGVARAGVAAIGVPATGVPTTGDATGVANRASAVFVAIAARSAVSVGVGAGVSSGAPGGAKRFSAKVWISSGVTVRPRSSRPCR